MIIPELTIHTFLKDMIMIINNDYAFHPDKKKTILYKMFNLDDNDTKMKLNKFDFYEQAVSMLIKTNSDVRKLEITLGYNLSRMELPTIHILLPSETSSETQGIGNGIGWDADDQFESTEDGRFMYLNKNYDATYNLLITSDNSSEVVVLYNFFKYMITVLTPAMELSGLQSLRIGGGDLQFMEELIPTTVFHRNLNLSFMYENKITDLFLDKKMNDILFVGTSLQK